MTPFFAGLATGFLLGGICFGIFALVLLSFKRPATPPTFHHRRFRDLPVPEAVPSWERNEVGGIDYRFLGQTGEER